MNSRLKKIPINLVFTAGLFIVSVVYTIASFKLSFGSSQSPGAGYIPRIAGIFSCIVSAFIFFNDIRTGKRTYFELELPARPIMFVVFFIIYALIFEPVGYVISTILFTFALSMVMGNRLRTALIIAVSTGIAFFLVFSLLAVPLPKGILG